MTAWDWLDLCIVVGVIGVQIAFWKRSSATVWAVVSLAAYHVAGRIILDIHIDGVNQLLTLAGLQTVMGLGFLSSRWLTLWGVGVGCAYSLLSLVTCFALILGVDTSFKGGVAGPLIWNIESAILHCIAAMTVVGVIRHQALTGDQRRA